MIINIYSIRDIKASVHQFVVECENDLTAMRLTERMIFNVATMSEHPEDFHLYQVGTFDRETGLLKACDLRFVCDGLSLMTELNEKREDHAQTKIGDETPV
jgi:hypothetical protein